MGRVHYCGSLITEPPKSIIRSSLFGVLYFCEIGFQNWSMFLWPASICWLNGSTWNVDPYPPFTWKLFLNVSDMFFIHSINLETTNVIYSMVSSKMIWHFHIFCLTFSTGLIPSLHQWHCELGMGNIATVLNQCWKTLNCLGFPMFMFESPFVLSKPPCVLL